MTDLSDSEVKDFDFAQEMIKQVITLSDAIIDFTITSVVDFIGVGALHGANVLMTISWLFYILFVVFGILALGGLTGSLNRGETDVFGSNVLLWAIPHVVSFVLGLGLTIGAGWWAL